MLVLSHFDDDHVNGLELLLKKRRVKLLVLPYSEWPQILHDVAIGGVKGVSPSTAHLQIDSVGWLEVRDLTRQVDSVLLIQGGHADPDSLPLDPIPFPTAQNSENQNFEDIENDTSNHVQSDLRISSSPNASHLTKIILNHRQTFNVSLLPIEFMFYNAEISGSDLGIIVEKDGGLFSKKSKLPLSIVKKEVELVIQSLNLQQPISSLPKDWRTQLKTCYENHFGSTSRAKNNISLCLYFRSLPENGSVNSCRYFDEYYIGGNIVDIGIKDVLDPVRSAVLCTGDLKINRDVISAMESHFGVNRWRQIGLTQVPHHGSKNSWVGGNAKLLSPSAFVHCAPGSKAHPHIDVIADLDGFNVFTADYKSSVTLCYHFVNK